MGNFCPKRLFVHMASLQSPVWILAVYFHFVLEHEMLQEKIIANGRHRRAGHQGGQFRQQAQAPVRRKFVNVKAFHGGVGEDAHAHAQRIRGDELDIAGKNDG